MKFACETRENKAAHTRLIKTGPDLHLAPNSVHPNSFAQDSDSEYLLQFIPIFLNLSYKIQDIEQERSTRARKRAWKHRRGRIRQSVGSRDIEPNGLWRERVRGREAWLAHCAGSKKAIGDWIPATPVVWNSGTNGVLSRAWRDPRVTNGNPAC